MESPETNPHVYGQIIFNKGAKNIQWKKKASSINSAGKTESYIQKIRLLFLFLFYMSPSLFFKFPSWLLSHFLKSFLLELRNLVPKMVYKLYSVSPADFCPDISLSWAELFGENQV